jgi:ribosomal protein L37AE/L43A
MARPKGSTGIYSRRPPKKIAELWMDALLVSEEIEDTCPRCSGNTELKEKVTRADPLSQQCKECGYTFRGGQPPNKRLVAQRLKDKFPDKYGLVTEEHIRKMLSKDYLRKATEDDYNAFEAAVLKHLLGEKD